MAEVKQGILGGVSGKVGTVVGASWRGKNIIRARPRKTGKKASKKQLDHRSKFSLVSQFLQPLNFLLKRYFGTSQGLKSPLNLAMAYHINEAVVAQEDAFVIQVEKVVISKGILPTVTMNTVTVDHATLSLAWTINTATSLGKATDLLTVVVYDKQSHVIEIFDRVVTRGTAAFSMSLPEGIEVGSCVIWFFLTNEEDTECSTSSFVKASGGN